jgi:hypothetical protein
LGLNGRRPQGGWLCVTNTDGTIDEADTFTCAHCQKIVPCRAKQNLDDLGGFCRLCDRLICSRCVGRDCVPFLKAIEAAEEKEYRRRQFEQMAGA